MALRKSQIYSSLWRSCDELRGGMDASQYKDFYGTGIPVCIVVIDKAHAHARKGVFLVDASRGFRKDGPKNRLRAQDVHRIVDVFNRQVDAPGYARMAPLAEIAAPANDFNLNIPRYVDAGAPEDLHDLDAHLRGGVPDRDLDALGACWQVFPALRKALFEPLPGCRGYSRPRIGARQVQAAILGHEEFADYRKLVAARCFPAERAEVEKLRAEREAASAALDAFLEEHAGADGALADAANDKGKVTRGAVQERLRAVRDEPDEPDEPDGPDERAVLTRCLALMDAETAADKARPCRANRARPAGVRPLRHAHRRRDPDPRGGRQVARYAQLRDSGRSPDGIFGHLQQYAAGRTPGRTASSGRTPFTRDDEATRRLNEATIAED